MRKRSPENRSARPGVFSRKVPKSTSTNCASSLKSWTAKERSWIVKSKNSSDNRNNRTSNETRIKRATRDQKQAVSMQSRRTLTLSLLARVCIYRAEQVCSGGHPGRRRGRHLAARPQAANRKHFRGPHAISAGQDARLYGRQDACRYGKHILHRMNPACYEDPYAKVESQEHRAGSSSGIHSESPPEPDRIRP